MTAHCVFLAYPVSTATYPSAVNEMVRAIRDGLIESNWRVEPAFAGDERETDIANNVDVSSLLRSNVENVRNCDLLVVVAGDADEPSSIWIEFGIAIGAGIPILLLSPDLRPIPFLAKLAVSAPESGWRADHIRAPLPTTQVELDATVGAVVYWARQCFRR